jgi:hypothetical protein
MVLLSKIYQKKKFTKLLGNLNLFRQKLVSNRNDLLFFHTDIQWSRTNLGVGCRKDKTSNFIEPTFWKQTSRGLNFSFTHKPY